MYRIKEEVEERMYQLNRIIKEKQDAIAKAPDGTIHVSSADNRTQYYLHNNNKRTYLKESEIDKVKILCQKDYDLKILKAAERELKELEKLLKLYREQPCEEIYGKLHLERQKLVEPIWVPDSEYIKQWENVEYYGKGFYDDSPEYYTDKGERVRSKTEILIANALNRHGVPYRYEQPLYLSDYGTIHPDFTVLNVRLRKEIHWEHMGMMDNYEYAEDALKRIEVYEKNGYFPGDKLILTHETAKRPINSKTIEKIIEMYLK